MKTQKEIEDLKDAIGREIYILEDSFYNIKSNINYESFSVKRRELEIKYNILLEILK